MYTHKAYPIYLEESKGDSHAKAWEGPLVQSRCCAFHISSTNDWYWCAYPPCRCAVDKRPSRLQTWSFMCRSAPQLDSAHWRRLRKTDVNRCCTCRPVSCIRHSSTSTNEKKADGHDWRHRSMPCESRPSQQSPLLCTAKWQEEPMEEPEERTAARKCLSPLTVQHLYKRPTSAYGLQQVHICWWPLYHHQNKVIFNMLNRHWSWLLMKCPSTTRVTT